MAELEAPNYHYAIGTASEANEVGGVPLAVQEGAPFTPIVEDFEDDTFNVTIGGTWARDSSTANTGTWSFKAATITHNQMTDADITVPAGATLLSLFYKVSSESNFDFFRVLLDGAEAFTASGEIDWTELADLDVTGVTTVTFRYDKDGSVSSGSDTAWVDDLTFGAVSDSWQPLNLDQTGNLKVTATDFDIRDLVFATDKVDVSGSTVTIQEPLSVDDNGGSLTVDDGGGSITVDGTVSVSARTGNLANGTQTAVSTVAVQIAAANANRRSILIQNVGLGRARIGISGVTATTGFLLYPGGHLIFGTEDVPTNAIFAIRDGAPDTTILVQAVTT